MADSIRHRGPDAGGHWVDEKIGIGFSHRRLSILDLSSSGDQPMASSTGRYVVSFNGEVYNFLDLRQELQSHGHHFRGTSDTEVALAAIEQWGLSPALERFTGMFAFALWDRDCRLLHLVRDRVGKKPLYYTFQGKTLYFASEMKALRNVKGLVFHLSAEAIDEFLSFGAIHSARTVYNEVIELRPGHRLEIDQFLNNRLLRYWQPRWGSQDNYSREKAIAELDRLLLHAVRRRLHADVPLGVFLSGGIDSGLIVAIASRDLGRPLITLSAGFDERSFDERPLARLVAQRYGTDHRELVIRPRVVDLLPRIVQAYDEPFADSSAIPSYCLAELARAHVKVVLNGDGGDELFSGYRRYQAALFYHKFRVFMKPSLERIWELMDKYLPEPNTYRTGYAFVRRFIRGALQPEPTRYQTWCADGFTWAEKTRLYRQPPSVDYGNETLARRFCAFKEMDPLHQYLALDFTGMLPDDLLVKMDIATMAHGLEARSPFLDHHIVEWAHRLPTRLLLFGTKTKPLLRRIAHKYLPREVVTAPKRGFEVPLYRWLQNDLSEMCHDLLGTNTGLLNDLFTRAYREKLLAKKGPKDPARWARQAWYLLILALWDCHVLTGAAVF